MNADEPDCTLVFERSKPGWFRVTHPTTDQLGIYVTGRVDAETDSVVVTTVLLECRTGVRAADMRSVPLGRIEAHLTNAHNAWWIAQAGGEYLIADLEKGLDEDKPPFPRPLAGGRAKLTRPDGTDPTQFLALVADAYRELRQHTKNVALAIAAEANVPPATARRWIYDARRRGLLPEGGRGKG